MAKGASHDQVSESPPTRTSEALLARPPAFVPILPLRETVVFPRTTVQLTVGRERSVRLVEEVASGDKYVALVAQRNRDIEHVVASDLVEVGTTARVRRVIRTPDNILQVWVQGVERVRVRSVVASEPHLMGDLELLPDVVTDPRNAEALGRQALDLFVKVVELAPYLRDELSQTAAKADSPSELASCIATNLRVSIHVRQELLEQTDVVLLIRRLIDLMSEELEVLKLSRKMQDEVRDRMNQSQRDYFLREQIKAIQRELGEEDGGSPDVRQLRERLDAAKLPLEARKEADRELSRLEKLQPASAEYGVIRTYLDWIASLPWSVSTGGAIDLAKARAILDADHYDLQKVKARMVEYLAVRKLRQDRNIELPEGESTREPILCLVGPPGGGKTSLGQSIARAMGRTFVRMSLGGVRDEAEIRGHRRTYVGALPGRLLQSIRRAQANDPVFMFDEVDKLGADWRGDPAAALLEVLDPEQNKEFRDHYLDLAFDLSRVMFIATANTVDGLPPALRDRMEVLRLPGYTEEEKLNIAKTFLIPKQLRASGLRPEEIEFPDEVVRHVINAHTREAGVRNLEREISSLCRRVATFIADDTPQPAAVTMELVRSQLGRPKYHPEALERLDRPGVATGLVYTPEGGDIIFVEVSALPGRKGLHTTGQLGSVMRESAEASLSVVRACAAALGIDPKVFDRHDIHIHVPGGAVPKDGPSAGITIATALASALTGRLVRDNIAMTGEITLRGKVLAIGGVKEKVLGAHRAGIRVVVLPQRNEADLEDIAPELVKEMTFRFVENVDQVFSIALSERRIIDDETRQIALLPSDTLPPLYPVHPTEGPEPLGEHP